MELDGVCSMIQSSELLNQIKWTVRSITEAIKTVTVDNILGMFIGLVLLLTLVVIVISLLGQWKKRAYKYSNICSTGGRMKDTGFLNIYDGPSYVSGDPQCGKCGGTEFRWIGKCITCYDKEIDRWEELKTYLKKHPNAIHYMGRATVESVIRKMEEMEEK